MKNNKENNVEENERIVYFTRDSFCMGDDVTAPNICKYEWYDSDWEPECEIFAMIDDYIDTGLPGYFWRGYAGGKRIADINLVRTAFEYKKECKVAENWQELLRKYGCIHFMHAKYEERDELPETIEEEEYYTYEEAEEIFNEV